MVAGNWIRSIVAQSRASPLERLAIVASSSIVDYHISVPILITFMWKAERVGESSNFLIHWYAFQILTMCSTEWSRRHSFPESQCGWECPECLNHLCCIPHSALVGIWKEEWQLSTEPRYSSMAQGILICISASMVKILLLKFWHFICYWNQAQEQQRGTISGFINKFKETICLYGHCLNLNAVFINFHEIRWFGFFSSPLSHFLLFNKNCLLK